MAVLFNKAFAALTGETEGIVGDVVLGKTERGFTDYGEDIIDLNGNEVCVRESSAVGAECAWLFCTDPRPRQARLDAHRAEWAALTPEQQEARLPTWITHDYSRDCAYEDMGKKLRDYSDCPEEKERLITSLMHQTWAGEKELPPDPPPRLDAAMTSQVVDRLFAFAKHAGAPDNWRNSPEYRAVWGTEESL
jgi:hypothetical protein